MMENLQLKKDYCDYLIANNLVKAYDVIYHSYTNHLKDKTPPIIQNKSCNNIAPTISTRCDSLGVVVYDK